MVAQTANASENAVMKAVLRAAGALETRTHACMSSKVLGLWLDQR